MTDDYQYDIFISYRHAAPMLDWVKAHFYPLLQAWLPNYLPEHHKPEIFVDFMIEAGTEWPEQLRGALLRSRCLLAIWSPDYFRSQWCKAELETIRERERLLGRRSEDGSNGLLYPLRYADGDHYPDDVKLIQQIDIRDWNTPHEVFRHTAGYVDFDKKVQEIAERLAERILDAPPWDASWPVITPAVSPKRSVPLPKLT